MKNKIFIPIFIAFTFNLIGQENMAQKELGFKFHNFDNFGLNFKTGTENSLWNFSTLILNGVHDKKTDPDKVIKLNELGFTLLAGKEFRKPIISNFMLSYGFDLYFNYYRNTNETNFSNTPAQDVKYTSSTLRPGLNFNLGAIYSLPSNILVGASMNLFSIYYSKSKSERVSVTQITETESSEILYGFSNAYASLTLSYKFH